MTIDAFFLYRLMYKLLPLEILNLVGVTLEADIISA